ncbi:MAG: type II secretion system protein [Planctomycetota bacterium]
MSTKPIKQERSGFTLVELLLVISVIAVLSSLALFVVRGARSDAQHAATRMRSSQAEAAVQQRMENYEFRRVPVRLNDYVAGSSRIVLNLVRNRIIADMVHVEMPGVWRWLPAAARWEDDTVDSGDGFDALDDYAGVRQIPTVNSVGGIFPSLELESWLLEMEAQGFLFNVDPAGAAIPDEALINVLRRRQSSVVTQREIALASGFVFNDTSESLTWILEQTDQDGASAAESMGNRPFVTDPLSGRAAFVDGFDDRFAFRLMYADVPQDINDPADFGQIPPGDEMPPGSGMVPLADAIGFDAGRSWNISDIPFENIRVEIISPNEN